VSRPTHHLTATRVADVIRRSVARMVLAENGFLGWAYRPARLPMIDLGSGFLPGGLVAGGGDEHVAGPGVADRGVDTRFVAPQYVLPTGRQGTGMISRRSRRVTRFR
jgi:hypothetical protein